MSEQAPSKERDIQTLARACFDIGNGHARVITQDEFAAIGRALMMLRGKTFVTDSAHEPCANCAEACEMLGRAGIADGDLIDKVGDAIEAMERAAQPPVPDDAAFPLDTKVRHFLSHKVGTIIAIDTKYEIEGEDGEYWQAWHREVERHTETKGANAND